MGECSRRWRNRSRVSIYLSVEVHYAELDGPNVGPRVSGTCKSGSGEGGRKEKEGEVSEAFGEHLEAM